MFLHKHLNLRHFTPTFSLLFFALALSLNKVINAQNVVWANDITSNYNSLTINNMCTNGANEVITVGTFSDTIDFDPGPGIDMLNAGVITGSPISVASFISKASNAGSHLWTKAFVPYPYIYNSICIVNDVTVDNNGNLYVVGRYEYTVDFDPGIGVDSLNSNGTKGVFVVKLDSAGNYLWGKTILHNFIYLYSVKTDQNSNVILSGNFESTVDFDPGPSVYNMTASDNNQLFVLQLDNAGSFVWSKTWAGTRGNVSSWSRDNVEVDSANNVFICSRVFQNPIDLDPGLSVSNGTGSIMMVKLDQMGSYVWGIVDTANSVFIKKSKYGDVYLTGRASQLPQPVYISKFNSQGVKIWTKYLGDSISLGTYFTGTPTTIAEDSNGAILIGGIYLNNYFLYKVDSAGNYLWSKKSNSTLNLDDLTASYNVNNDLMVCADIQHVFDVNFGAGTYNVGQSGQYGSFLMKYNYCGSNYSFSYTGCDSVVTVDSTYFVSANYIAEYLDVSNCDSNVTIHVTLNILNDVVLNGCDSVVYNGQTYTQSGMYTQIVTPPAPGCDSVLHITVNINTPANQPSFLNLIQTLQPISSPSGYVYSNNIEIDSLYNIYICGSFNHWCDFNPLGNAYIDSSYYIMYNGSDGFVTRYDSTGHLNWMHKVQTMDPNGSEYTRSICLNDTLSLFATSLSATSPQLSLFSQYNYNNLYFGSSQLQGQVMGNPIYKYHKILMDPINKNMIKVGEVIDQYNYINYQKLLIIRGNSYGNQVAIFPSGYSFVGTTAAVDEMSNLYIAGKWNPSSGQLPISYILKLDSFLNVIWYHSLGTNVYVSDIKVLDGSNIVVGGNFTDSIDIDLSPNIHFLNSKGGNDAFIACIDTSANLVWAHSYGGTNSDDHASTITTDLNGNIYVGGGFSSSIDLDPSAGVSFFMKGCLNANWTGGYISKFKPDGTFVKAFGTGSVSELEFKAPNRIYAVGNPFLQVFELEQDTIVNNSIAICAGDSITVGNAVYTQAGTYVDTFALSIGIDSIVITNLVVNPLPTVVANSSDSLVCVGNPVVLFGTGADSFVWTNAVIDSVSFYPIDTATYVVTGIDINGCTNQDSISIFVNQIPFPVLVFSGDTIYCTNVPNATIFWFKDTMLVDSLINYYVVTQNGNYGVLVIDSSGCMGADSLVLFNVGLHLNSPSNSVVVYPNPTNSILNIEFSLNEEALVNYTLNDIVGHGLMLSKPIKLKSGIQKIRLDLNGHHLKSGIYFLNLKINNKMHVVKIDYLN